MTKGKSTRLRPSLWRTCRTLANRARLNIFRYVLSHPGLSVKLIASGLDIKPALASKYPRELNARGLLAVTRRAAHVFYRVRSDPSMPHASALVKALIDIFHDEKTPDAVIFRKVTAFTHPRRIAIAGRLRARGPARFSDLRKLGISTPALQRHLRKLASRGFLQVDMGRGVYAVIHAGSALDMALLNLVVAEY